MTSFFPRPCVFLVAVALAPVAARGETPPDPPVLRFEASGDHAFSSGRITVDARLADGAALTVRLTAPSGRTETLPMRREAHRHTWTGVLGEAGDWRAEATVSGPGGPLSASGSVSLRADAPTCSVSIRAPETRTHYLDAEIVVDTCEATSRVGQIATRYARVSRDGKEISTLDATESCERRFVLPGAGDYEARLEVVDDRGIAGTCETSGLGVAAHYPRAWITGDLVGGVYRTGRADLPDTPRSAALAGAGLGLMIARDPGAERTTALSVRAGGGIAHDDNLGISLDLALTREAPAGFFGAEAGLWGIGDADLLDAAFFGTAGVNLPAHTGAGQAQLLFEVRAFARHLTGIQDNFTGFVGLRFHFEPTHTIETR